MSDGSLLTVAHASGSDGRREAAMWIQKVPGGGVSYIAFSADGRTLYTLDTSGWLTAWDTLRRTPARLANFPGRQLPYYFGLHPLADGRLVLHGDNLRLLDPAGEIAATVADLTPGRLGFEQIRPDGRVYYLDEVRWSVSGRDLATSAVVPGFAIPPVFGDLSSPGTFDIAPDGRRVAVSFGRNDPAVLFELADGELRNPLPLPGSGGTIRPQFTPGGETLVLSWYYPPRFAAWDAATQAPRFAPVGFERISSRYAVHPTAPLLAALNAERRLTLFSLESGEVVRTLDFALGRYVKCAAFAPDGLTCAVGGSNKQFAVFDVDV